MLSSTTTTTTTMGAIAPAARVIHGHPALLRWSPPTAHSFAAGQLEALAAICNAFVPSLEPPPGSFDNLAAGVTAADITRFYKLNPSDEAVVDVVAATLGYLMRPLALKTLLSVMGLLTTGWGTLLLGALGGVNTCTLRYPFLPRFASLAPSVQEKVLQGWSRSPLSKIRQLFKALKAMTGWTVYSMINEHGENPAWKAIGYSGVAPEVQSRTEAEYERERPLGEHHINAGKEESCARLKQMLTAKGFRVVEEMNPSFTSQAASLGYENKGQQGDMMIHVECDAVIVGSGSGGGVMAAALAKHGFKVVVVEKGDYFAAQDFTSLEGPSMINMLEKMGCMATDDGGVELIAGKAVGGGTTVNWCVSFKTPEHVRDEWVKEHGLELFHSEQYDLALQAVWERLSVQPDVHQHSLQNTVLQEGCHKLGFECATLQRNCSPDHFCGWCSFGCPTGKKQSTAETWLVDAVTTGNVVILSNCDAQHVFHGENPDGKKGRRAQGVVASLGGGRNMFIKANATVVSCGALMTPVLLLRSGLRNPNIGKYLRLHPASSSWGYFPEGAWPAGKSYEGGIMTVCSPVTLRKPTEYGGLLETGAFHPAAYAAFYAWCSGADGKERMLRHSRTSHVTVVTRDKGFGTVTLDKQQHPIFSYHISKYDEESLVAGLVQSLRVLVAVGAIEIGTSQLDGERFNAKDASTSEIESYLERVKRRGAKEDSIQLVSAHQLGSCRMGTSPTSSAVDPKGEMWEVEGLFIGDGSVLPTSSGVNPMVTIQSIAYCTADSVVQYLKKF